MGECFAYSGVQPLGYLKVSRWISECSQCVVMHIGWADNPWGAEVSFKSFTRSMFCYSLNITGHIRSTLLYNMHVSLVQSKINSSSLINMLSSRIWMNICLWTTFNQSIRLVIKFGLNNMDFCKQLNNAHWIYR